MNKQDKDLTSLDGELREYLTEEELLESLDSNTNHKDLLAPIQPNEWETQ